MPWWSYIFFNYWIQTLTSFTKYPISLVNPILILSFLLCHTSFLTFLSIPELHKSCFQDFSLLTMLSTSNILGLIAILLNSPPTFPAKQHYRMIYRQRQEKQRQHRHLVPPSLAISQQRVLPFASLYEKKTEENMWFIHNHPHFPVPPTFHIKYSCFKCKRQIEGVVVLISRWRCPLTILGSQ